MFQQISYFFDKMFSMYQRGYRNGFNAQHCLVAIVSKMESYNDKGKSFGALNFASHVENLC